MPLTKGLYALVDAVDHQRVSRLSWYARKAPNNTYAAHWARGNSNLFMHHFILGTRDRVDHVDGNGLNNRRDNLRPATHSQNMANRRKFRGATSRFKGVSRWRGKNGRERWIAYISVNKKRHHLGLFEVEEDAARAYDAAALKHFGEFSRLNLPSV